MTYFDVDGHDLEAPPPLPPPVTRLDLDDGDRRSAVIASAKFELEDLKSLGGFRSRHLRRLATLLGDAVDLLEGERT